LKISTNLWWDFDKLHQDFIERIAICGNICEVEVLGSGKLENKIEAKMISLIQLAAGKASAKDAVCKIPNTPVLI
jgi:hypothetical protein